MKSNILTLILIIITSIAVAQSITNINAAQRTDGSMLVDIFYDLLGPDPEYTITVEASFDDGNTFIDINSVSGDVGGGIAPDYGKDIVWSYGTEFPGQYNPHTRIRITATPWACGSVLIDNRDGQTYPTVQIGNQCWMAKNINIGTMINGANFPSNNGTIEKYCYDNTPGYCDTYGGLYTWHEMMQYVTTPGAQGICPVGWHIPSDDEWCTLENEVDADTIFCSSTGWRGIDAGGNLKETGYTHWNVPNEGATNSSGFTALPGGYYVFGSGGFFAELGHGANFWSSTYTWRRYLSRWNADIYRDWVDHKFGYSIRCLRN